MWEAGGWVDRVVQFPSLSWPTKIDNGWAVALCHLLSGVGLAPALRESARGLEKTTTRKLDSELASKT